MTAPLETLLGVGYPTSCRVLSDEVAIHWWPSDAKRGDHCLCGKRTKGRPLRSPFDSRRAASRVE